MTNVKCVKKKWLNSTAIERWKNFYILPGTENLSSFLSVFQTSCFLSWQVSENVLVIRALFKAQYSPYSIAANVKNLFLSLAFSDLGVGLVSQLNGRHYFRPDTEDSIKRRLQLNVTLSNSFKFELLWLVFSLHCIPPNCHDHCIRQTSRCFAPSAISRACHVQTCHYSDNSGKCSYLQSCQISPESDIQSKSASKCKNKGGTQTKEVRL